MKKSTIEKIINDTKIPMSANNHEEMIFTEAFNAALDRVLEKLPESNWVSVNERLPENDAFVLACIQYLDNSDKYVHIMHLSEYSPKIIFTGYSELFDKRFKKVTHWQALPEPPK